MRQLKAMVLAASMAMVVGGAALGQWSANPSAPLVVADRSGEQNQPKIVPTADGGCYISWFDNSTGGYDVYLQRLDAAGNEQWAHNGVLLADRTVSSTQDHDLVLDSAGNALSAFNDPAGATPQIRVQKVSPAGVLLWGAAGAVVPGAASQSPPHIAELSDGSIIVAWTESNTLKMQRLTSLGAPVGPVGSFNEAGRSMLMCDVCAGDNGTFIAMWARGSGTNYQLSTKHLYAQKYDQNFAAQWPTGGLAAKGVFTTTSLGSGYFPYIMTDGAGGMVIGYYEGGGAQLAYIQHILADGTSKFAGAGLPSPIAGGRIAVGAGGAYDAASGEYFLSWPEVISGAQNRYTVSVQKWDSAGAAQWGAAGVPVIEYDAAADYQNSFVQTVKDGRGGCFVFGFRATGTAGGSPLWTWGAQATGGARRWFQFVCDITGGKARLASALSVRGHPQIVYGNGAGGSLDIVAQAFQQDGTIAFCDSDIGVQGGTPGHDMSLNNNDFIVFINFFFVHDPRADVGVQGGLPGADALFDNNDFIVFINSFFNACL